ncbi:MAG: hypothetical protein QF541_04580 [Lentisphaeria bacterium]|nr:hypothetical protein [Lentisphaeria bacterium]
MPISTVNLLPIVPTWFIAVVAAALLMLLVYGSRQLLERNVPQRWMMILFCLRLLIIISFVLCLLRPALSKWREEKLQPTLLVLADVSRSMSEAGESGKGTRFDETTGVLLAPPGIARLEQEYDLHCYAFDDSTRPMTPDTLAAMEPQGESTRIGQSLESAWNQYRSGSSATASAEAARILLISDGANLAGDDALGTAQRLGLRVDTLTPVPGHDGADLPALHIADVQSSNRVLVDSETRFRVTLAGRADGEQMLTATYNGKPFYEHSIDAASGDVEARLIVTHRPKTPGISRYAFSLTPAAEEEMPAYELNVHVVDAKHEVLVLEDTWRWEFKYLRRVLEDDPSFNLTAFLARDRASYVQFSEPERGVSLAGFPEGPAEIDWFDVIVLGNVDPDRWSRRLASAIADSVVERGKSLIIIAGPDIGRLARVPELGPLLPVEIGARAGVPIEGPVSLRINAEAGAMPYFSIRPETHQMLPAQALPPVDRIYAPIRKRPAATVLLEAQQHANAYGNLIVMAEHTVGRGRVLYIGTDTLWKWHMYGARDKARGTLHRRFWQQTLRALAPPLADAGGGNLSVRTDRSRYTAGERVALTAELYPPEASAAVTVAATVVMPDGQRLVVPVTADPRAPGKRIADFRVFAPGRCRITTTATRNGELIAESVTAVDVQAAPGESGNIAVDAGLMAALAEATGGTVIDAADRDSWPTEPQTAERTVRRAVIHDLWYNFALPLLLFGLLGIDWLLRLLRGYF